MRDVLHKPVSELAGLVRSGQVSARELASASLERIEALQPSLNAFIEFDGERALAAADAVQPGPAQPFAGVPIAIKGNTPVAGWRLTFGSRFFAEHRAAADAYLVRRLREAGFVIVGITNLPEFGIVPTTEPQYHGPARNPWDPERTPGGSSGGAAAAVAAGMVPVAHGNDGGGSIRIPAACCGLLGLKPSRGRISRGPELGESLLSVEGVLTRSVMDTALLLDVLAGYEVGDATWAPRPDVPYGIAARRDPGRLRVGVCVENPLGAELDPECRRGLEEAARLLDSLGHSVEEATPPQPGPEALGLFTQAFAPWVSLALVYGEFAFQRAPEEGEIEPLSRALRDLSEQESSLGYLTAVVRLQSLARSLVAFFADYDLMLTPALAERPLPIGELTGHGADPLGDFARSGRFVPYSPMFNVTGQPAIAVPVGMGSDGLPTSVQIVAKPLGEETLLQVAAQMEAANPWADRRPEGSSQGAAAA